MSEIEPAYCLSSGKPITGTLVWYYSICKREVWLMSREITPDEDNAALDIGRAIHEIFYRKAIKEISMEGIKIDLFKKAEMVICEVKTSTKFIEAARFQLLYYLYRFKEYGLNLSGWILVPKEKRKIKVTLDEGSESALLKVLYEIKTIVELENPPAPIKIPYCKRCAYKEFCWA